MRLTSIDPGECTGWAHFNDGTLENSGIATPNDSIDFGDNVVIERPQIYTVGNSKADPNDIITLAITVGRYVERASVRGAEIRLVLPAVWKGQVPKRIHHPRIMTALTRAERAFVEGLSIPLSRAGNMIDAIGLGLWKLGRL